MSRCMAHTTSVMPQLHGRREREREVFLRGTHFKESMRDFIGRAGVSLSNTLPYGTVQLWDVWLPDTQRRGEREKSSGKQLGLKVSICSYPRPQGWWRRSSSDDKLSHFGNNQIGYKLSVLFHMLPNQGHRAVHHLPQEGKTTVSKEVSWWQVLVPTHLSH